MLFQPMTSRKILSVMDLEMVDSERDDLQCPMKDTMNDKQEPPSAVERSGQKCQCGACAVVLLKWPIKEAQFRLPWLHSIYKSPCTDKN